VKVFLDSFIPSARISRVPRKRGRPKETARVHTTIHVKRKVLRMIDSEMDSVKTSRGKVIEAKFQS